MLTYSTRFIEPPKFALSIRQPWAKLILSHQKNMEYRVWRLPELHCNTWLYLHVPLNMSKYEKEFARQLYGSKDLPCGGYIGYIMFGTPVRYDTPEEARPYASHPFCWHWPIIGRRRIPFIPARGQQRIFAVQEASE